MHFPSFVDGFNEGLYDVHSPLLEDLRLGLYGASYDYAIPDEAMKRFVSRHSHKKYTSWNDG